VRLTMAGGGGQYEELKESVERKNLNNIINMAGRIKMEKMPDVYRQHDIFVTATMQEGMSNAMLEAMASGLPIITTRCEGVEELISDNGIVVDESSAEALAGAIERLVEDKQNYRAMCLSARKKAEKFDWKCVAEEYIKIYQRIGRK
jgi:glycosyltransferase involved in cell wall biosynthesis